MDFQKKYSEIQQFLSIPDNLFTLDEIINSNFKSEEIKIEILSKILSFIYNFQMFKQNRAFMKSVYKCIMQTLEIKLIDIKDFEELLIKNSLMRFIQEYLEYSQIGQKEQVLNFLADSFERLGLQPLILNLGLLLKPMYSDQRYIDKVEKFEEVEVVYVLNDEAGMEIKRAIDKWLSSQTIDLEKQDELMEKLKEEFDRLVSEHNLSKESKSYKILLTEVIEMLSMKLTMISLMDSISDNEFEPVPIK
ncbi:MAG: hypothetical protein ACTSPD_18125 [Promethearchaeota archaeon]